MLSVSIKGWLAHREHATGLSNALRLLIGMLSLCGISVGVFAILKNEPAEAGGTAILIGAVVLLLLALVGRFPDKLAGGGWELEFRPDTIRQILSLVQSESPELATKVEELVRSGTRPSDIASAVLRSVGDDRAADVSFEERARRAIAEIPGIANLEQDSEVQVPGVGRRPIVDLRARVNGRNIIVEVKGTWTPSVADFTGRRLIRALRADDVEIAVLVVDAIHVQRARADIDDDRVIVIPLEEINTLPARLSNHRLQR